jgi:hypothetical protein
MEAGSAYSCKVLEKDEQAGRWIKTTVAAFSSPSIVPRQRNV